MRPSPATRRSEAIQAAALAAIQNKPHLDPHDLAQAQRITAMALGWLREVYKHLDGRTDLQSQAKRAGRSLAALERTLQREGNR